MPSIETRTSWAIAVTVLAVMSFAFGAPFVTVVALKPIAAELGSVRTVPALGYSLAWFGSAIGGIAMGRIADRIGTRWTMAFGAAMIGLGLAIASTAHSPWLLWLGHGVFVGLLGIGGINAPGYVYVSRWFDQHRGTALALISSGQYVAGVLWPSIFERGIAFIGWRETMLAFGVAVAGIVVPLALLTLRTPPEIIQPVAATGMHGGTKILGLPPNLVLALLAAAAFMCCVPMAMPQSHLVAFCSDLGIPASQGAAMLSVLLGCAFLSRQMWGWMSDRIGGLTTILCGSICQIIAMAGFLSIRNEAGLFAVSTFFGLGFAGMVPAYVLAVRQLFPAAEAAWRIPTVLLFSGSGMATGGWLAGYLYDHFGFYGVAFATGMTFNLGNLIVIGALVFRYQRLFRPTVSRLDEVAGN
jgi:MFS family permease